MILHVGKEWLDKCRKCKNLLIAKQDGEIYYRKCKAKECIYCAPTDMKETGDDD